MGIAALVSLVVTLAQERDKYKKASEAKGVKTATVSGADTVRIGGRTYPYILAVDIMVRTGDQVYVMISDTGSKAVVIGK